MKGIKNEDIERLINPKEVLLEKRQELINIYTESYGRKNKRQIENKMDNAIYIFDSIPTESEFFYDSYKINFNGNSKYEQIKEEADDYKKLKSELMKAYNYKVLNLLKNYFHIIDDKEEEILKLNFRSYSSEIYKILLNSNIDEIVKQKIRKQRTKYQKDCHELGITPITDFNIIDKIISRIDIYEEIMMYELMSESKFIKRKQQEIYEEKGIFLPTEVFLSFYEKETIAAGYIPYYDYNKHEIVNIVYVPILELINIENIDIDKIFLHENRHLLEAAVNLQDYNKSEVYNGIIEIRTEKNAIQDSKDIKSIFVNRKSKNYSIYKDLFPLCGNLFDKYRYDFNMYFFEQKIAEMEKRTGNEIKEFTYLIDDAIKMIQEYRTQDNFSELIIYKDEYLEKVRQIKKNMNQTEKRKTLFSRFN